MAAYYKNICAALMCSEGKPQQFHRSKLIGTVFRQNNINLQHIDENGQLKDQAQIELRIAAMPSFNFELPAPNKGKATKRK